MFWLFLGYSGRISRAAYFLAGMLMMIVVVFFAYRMMVAQQAGGTGAMWEALFSLALLVSLWAQAALGAKRLHDLDKPGLLAALLFVPMLNFVAFVALCIMPGTPGANKFGPFTNAPAVAKA
jgi:uncharacterized membrane protein YhaH (DUF805 family)